MRLLHKLTILLIPSSLAQDEYTAVDDYGQALDLDYEASPELNSEANVEVQATEVAVDTQNLTVNLPDQEAVSLQCGNPENVVEVSKNGDGADGSDNTAPQSNTIVWDWAKNMADFEANEKYIISVNGELDLKKRVLSQLDGQISADGENDLQLDATSVSAAGVYSCRRIDGEDVVYSIYDVSIISEPTMSIGDSVMVAGKSMNFNCDAKDAYPEVELSLYVDDELIDASNLSQSTDQDQETLLYTTLAEYTLQIPSDQQAPYKFRCEASNSALSQPISLTETKDVEFQPVIESISGLEIPVGASEHVIDCVTNWKPEGTVKWIYDEAKLPEGTIKLSEDSSQIIITNASFELHHNQTLKCVASNNHGSTYSEAQVTVVEASADPQSAGMDSNTVLIIGIVVGIIILSVIGAVVFISRRKKAQNYETNEADKEAGPEGVDYEQNPEREALAPGEENTQQKELLM